MLKIIYNHILFNYKMRTTCDYKQCNKKLNSVMIVVCKCRCEKIFCFKHKLPELHNCTYIYFTNDDKKKFIENNKIVKKKISII
jgi:hypothetical protein